MFSKFFFVISSFMLVDVPVHNERHISVTVPEDEILIVNIQP